MKKQNPLPKVCKRESYEAVSMSRRVLNDVLCVAAVALVVMSVLLLAGCAAPSSDNTSPHVDTNGYQFGDVTDTLRTRQEAYCREADPERRALLLAALRTQFPLYPPSGLCSDAERALAEELARQAADLPPVDVEQAREDQRRFAEDPATEE